MRVKLFTQRSSFEARVDIPSATEELKRISATRHCIGAIRLETWKTANRVLLNMVKEKEVVQGAFSVRSDAPFTLAIPCWHSGRFRNLSQQRFALNQKIDRIGRFQQEKPTLERAWINVNRESHALAGAVNRIHPQQFQMVIDRECLVLVLTGL